MSWIEQMTRRRLVRFLADVLLSAGISSVVSIFIWSLFEALGAGWGLFAPDAAVPAGVLAARLRSLRAGSAVRRCKGASGLCDGACLARAGSLPAFHRGPEEVRCRDCRAYLRGRRTGSYKLCNSGH